MGTRRSTWKRKDGERNIELLRGERVTEGHKRDEDGWMKRERKSEEKRKRTRKTRVASEETKGSEVHR